MQEAERLKYQKQLRDALIAIKKLKTHLKAEKEKDHEPIAVIGMGMRYPGHVENAEDFWHLLESGIDAITDIPENRFDAKSLYDSDYEVPGKMVVKQGGYLDKIDQFDGSFFDVSYAELESMDPQQRLLLEVTHEAIENAGIPVQSLSGSNTGVFIGVTNNDYQKKHFRSGDFNLINPYSYTGIAQSSHSGRISYLMGLQGPSLSLDTACSSSLVATHLAAQALRNRECELAIVGAANLILDPEFTIYFSALNALSKDSRCKSFSNEANGFIRSEGCGVLLLKRLSDAERDNDNILAVVKGTAVNQDGRSNGFTAPNVKAQERLILQALENAQLRPEQIGCIEAHGTGTKIGDPIEMEAISSVFAAHKTKEHPLYVSAVKTNIGHTESAAGVAGIMKAILSVQKSIIPKNLHFKTPNELIDWESLPVAIPVKNTPWNGADRYIGVSGFGVTGTNAHVIIGPAPTPKPSGQEVVLRNDVFVLPLSARTMEALQALAKAYANFIQISDASIEAVCAMAALKRSPFEIKKVFVARNKESLIEELNDFTELSLGEEKTLDEEDQVKVVFVCPGQGAQWVGMAQQLYQSEPVFKNILDQCATSFSKIVSWDLIEELNGQRFDEIDVIQPVLVAIEIGLGELWKSKGIQPDIVVGHSMGEVAAAYLAGMISLDDAATIICTRSSLMKQTSGQGAMAVTDLTKDEARGYLEGKSQYLSVAVQNSPHSTVISGDPMKLQELHDQLESEGRFCRMIKVDVASHSPQMDSLMPPLRDALKDLQPQNSQIGFYSTALNEIIHGSDLNADYWLKNLRNPVQFGSVIQAIVQKSKAVFIELSPHPVLSTAIQENIDFADVFSVAIPSLWREKDELVSFYKAFGAYWESGLNVDWQAIYSDIREFVLLPNYQWQRERFWYDEKPNVIALNDGHVSKKIAEKDDVDTIGTQKNLFEISWEEVTPKSVSLPKSVAIVMDSEDVGNQVRDLLIQKGVQVETILSSEKPQQFPEVLIHLSCTNVKATQQDAIYSFQSLIKYFSEKGKVPQLYAISKNGQIVDDQDKQVNVPSTALWGMMRTIRNEHPELKAITIDINSSTTAQDIVNVLSQDHSIREWANRRHKWFTPILKKVKASHTEMNPIVGDATYLVTGGTSGLGLFYAQWLASKGVKNLALVSRSGMKPETEAVINQLKGQGVNAQVFRSDISKLDDLSNLVMEVESSLPIIKGVVHAAGVLDDAPFLNLTSEQFNKVLAPKLNGGWNLHKYFSGRKLESFILFSSGASVLGTAAQANYAAANMTLDQLANYRKSSGQAALAINFGNIGEIGLAAADVKRGESLKGQGMNTISPDELHQYFEILFDMPGSQYMLMDIDFTQWSKLNSNVENNRLFSEVMKESAVDEEQSEGNKFLSKNAALRHYKGLLKDLISNISKIPVSRIKEDATFKSMGVDSLMAVQLKNKLQSATGLQLAVSSIWAYPTVEKYSDFIVSELDINESSETEEEESDDSTFVSRGAAIRNFKKTIKQHLSLITRMPESKMREDATFKSMGVDSLMAVQLKNKFQVDFGVNIAVSSIWAYPTIEKYADFVADELGIVGEVAVEEGKEEIKASPKAPAQDDFEKEVGQMSLDDLLKALDDD